MGLFKWIKSFWHSDIVNDFKEFLAALFKGALEIALAALKDIAIQAVTQVAADPKILTNEDKRKEAAKIVAEYAKGRGIEAGDSVVNLAVELAVQYIKK